MKLVHWPLMGGLLHLVQRGGDWAWFNLLLNADKSQAIVLGTANELRSATSIDSVEVAGVALPVATTLKSLGVILDQRLTLTQLQGSSHVTITLERLGVSDIC